MPHQRIGSSPSRWPRAVAVTAGSMMVGGAALNAVVTIASPGSYSRLGEWMNGPQAVRRVWSATMGDRPRVWVLLVGVGYELTVGVLTLSRNPRRSLLGLEGVAAFKAGLLPMGLWWWALPWLAILAPVILRTARAARPQGDGRSP